MVRSDEGDASAANVADALLPEAAILSVSIAETLTQLMEGLTVHPEVMRRNLDLSGSYIMSEAVMMRLAERIGRHRAHHLLYEVAQRSVTENLPFAAALAGHATLEGMDVESLLDPTTYMGEAPDCVDDVLASHASGASRSIGFGPNSDAGDEPAPDAHSS